MVNAASSSQCACIYLYQTCVALLQWHVSTVAFVQFHYHYCPVKMWPLASQYHSSQVKMWPLASQYHYCKVKMLPPALQCRYCEFQMWSLASQYLDI